MKIKSKNYSLALIEALEANQNAHQVASNFIDLLYKNKQEKSLKKILDSLDEAYAQKNNMLVAKVFSSEKLTDANIDEIKNNLAKKYNKKIIIKNIIKKEKIAGITVEVDGIIQDLSLANKIETLKKRLLK